MAYNSHHVYGVIGAIGAIGSIAAVGFWLLDTDRRVEEGAIRKNELLRTAKEIITNESSDGAFYSTPDVMWAFKVHARFQESLDISAAEVVLAFADLYCLDLRFKSSNVSIYESYLIRTFIDLEDSTLDFERSFLSDNIISINQTFLTPLNSSDYSELKFATSVRDSVVMGLSIDALLQQASNVTFSNSFVSDIGAAIEPHMFSTTGGQIVESGSLNESLCSSIEIRERDEIVYVECNLLDQASTDKHREYFRDWSAQSIVARNRGKPDFAVCDNIGSIDISGH